MYSLEREAQEAESMSVDRRWYMLVAARVLERGAKKLGDSSLASLAKELRERAEWVNRRRDILDILDVFLDQALEPLERLLELLDRWDM